MPKEKKAKPTPGGGGVPPQSQSRDGSATPRKPRPVEIGCPHCGASGHCGDEPRPQDNPFCPMCKGSGRIPVLPEAAAACPECKGRGHIENVPCFPCAHTGKVAITEVAPETSTASPSPDPDELIALKAENTALQTQVKELQDRVAALQELLSPKPTPDEPAAHS